MKLSVIIPALNEAKHLKALLPVLTQASVEVIVVDGSSTDQTPQVASTFPVQVIHSKPNRATQLNAGAAKAQGEALLFLHADSLLPDDWEGQILSALEDPRCGGGAFVTRIQGAGIGYRILDLWGVFKSRVGSLFFGDQGIFVRKEVFESLGGFQEWPALEDVDFSKRLKQAGRVTVLKGPLGTSARRWQMNGFIKTVFEHSALIVGFYLGRDPTPLRYEPVAERSRKIDVVLMAKAPIPGQVKTRLVPPLTNEQAAGLSVALLQDTAARLMSLNRVRQVLAVEPATEIPRMKALVGSMEVMAQQPGTLGERLSSVAADRLNKGAAAVLFVGSDHPTIPTSCLEQALQHLRLKGDRLVLGPAEDGGYYLIGFNHHHPELFEQMPWSESTLFEKTVACAKRLDLNLLTLPKWYDVDSPKDLENLYHELERLPDRAPATAAWLHAQHSAIIGAHHESL